jgi:hypothetical protein
MEGSVKIRFNVSNTKFSFVKISGHAFCKDMRTIAVALVEFKDGSLIGNHKIQNTVHQHIPVCSLITLAII